MAHPNEKIVLSLKELAVICEEARASGQRVVLTSGCFDLLHGGHLEYICDAGGMGDILVIGINSDAFVKRLKGEGRPIRDEHDRAFLMAGFSVVHHVMIFECDYELICAVRPDVYVASNTSHVRVMDDPERMRLLALYKAKIVELSSEKTDSTTDIIQRSSVRS